ncbi:pimeloyl-[acyl-carrier protein] methyl ester esterase [Pseudonocardia sediminis]|uniref:Pimeloyl-[acyl-carrier protein] methyl ester esterase n=1 Tax=Pseudonocardia sediminis TaxID=1397368 RepID=A0A4Q7V3D0_PSEST|nr:alpha/beta hydrolase [Pseudonocardia sediminis]RZT88906.1 pimeloyl-[acyl-carrier protein] methyl ester esterase [Pseudonocardia sediminis]
MAQLEVDSGKHVYYEHYSGSGRAVVLVHGWAVTGHCWDSTVSELLTAGHEVVVLDLRACGRSDKDFADVSIEALAGDVVALVRELELRSPVLSGWSLGGAVVVAAAAELGAEVAGLVLTAGATPRYTASDDWPHGSTVDDVEGVLAGLLADRAGAFRAVAEAVCAAPQSEPTLAWLWGQFLESGPRVSDTMRALADVDQRGLLPGITCPVLLLAGADDGFMSYSGVAASADLFPDARLVRFDGVGHAPFLEDQEAYLTNLLSFLNGVDT